MLAHASSGLEERWVEVESAAGAADPTLPAAGDLLVPLALWRRLREVLRRWPGRLGLRLEADEDPEPVAEDLPLFGLVAVRVRPGAEAAACATAKLLRSRYGYRGRLLAAGEAAQGAGAVLRDCGFDAFALRAGGDRPAADGARGQRAARRSRAGAGGEPSGRAFVPHEGAEWS